MRFHVSAVAAFALASSFASTLPAFAADYPVLRGTSSPSLPPAPMIQEEATPWEGFYVGGLAGQNAVNFNPSSSGSSLLAGSTLFQSTYYEAQGASGNLILPQYSSRGVAFGAFAGYNMQVGEAVVGLEADYMKINRGGSSSGPIVGRSYVNTAGTEQANVTTNGTSAARLNDLATFRFRAGYTLGSVMPYVTGGLAVGYGTVTTSTDATVTLQTRDPTTFALGLPGAALGSPVALVNRRTNAFMLGLTGGAGVELMLGGLLLRGEYLFSRLQAQGGVIIDVNQARVGAGVKF